MRIDKTFSKSKNNAVKQKAALNIASYGAITALKRAETIEYGKVKFKKSEKDHLPAQNIKYTIIKSPKTETVDDDSDFFEYLMIGVLTSMALAWLFIPSSHPLIIHIIYSMKPFFIIALPVYLILFLSSLFFNEARESISVTKPVKIAKPVVITPKRVKLELSKTNTLLSQSPMTASTDEQLLFADKANNQLVVNNVVIAAFDKEKAIDLTIANEQLKTFLLTLESSILSTIK